MEYIEKYNLISLIESLSVTEGATEETYAYNEAIGDVVSIIESLPTIFIKEVQ